MKQNRSHKKTARGWRAVLIISQKQKGRIAGKQGRKRAKYE